jgi:hypothetical protein
VNVSHGAKLGDDTRTGEGGREPYECPAGWGGRIPQ